MSEIWTATSEADGRFTFDVLDEVTGETRQETRLKDALPLMFVLGGYPEQMGCVMAMQPLPWRFRKDGPSIYIDGPSVGAPEYHPIDADGDGQEAHSD